MQTCVAVLDLCVGRRVGICTIVDELTDYLANANEEQSARFAMRASWACLGLALTGCDIVSTQHPEQCMFWHAFHQ